MALIDVIRSMPGTIHESFNTEASDDDLVMLPVCDSDKIFVQRDGVILEYDRESDTLVDTNFKLVKIDRTNVAKKKIQEICAGISYESNSKKPYKTESFVFHEVVDAKVIDLITDTANVSSLMIRPIIEFLVNVNADIIELLKKSIGMEGEHSDLDIPTVCIIAINAVLTGGDSNEIIKLKKILLLTAMIMEQVDEMKAAVKHKNDVEIKPDEKKEPAKEDNKKGSSK